jgi:chromosome segregation ATPase
VSAADKLEALMKVEQDIKAQYEKKVTAERYKLEESNKTIAKLQATLSDQAAQISELKASGSDSKRLEQEIREVTNRSEKLKNEIEAQRSKTKLAQKELNELKSENKALKQLDAKKLKKNLFDTKKKLEESRTANNLLSANIKKYKQENHEHLSTIEKLEAELEELRPKEDESETEDKVEKEAAEA